MFPTLSKPLGFMSVQSTYFLLEIDTESMRE
jgi:hypothetical protein